MPHGGFKESGYGKDLSGYSLEDYTRVKHVMSSTPKWGPSQRGHRCRSPSAVVTREARSRADTTKAPAVDQQRGCRARPGRGDRAPLRARPAEDPPTRRRRPAHIVVGASACSAATPGARTAPATVARTARSLRTAPRASCTPRDRREQARAGLQAARGQQAVRGVAGVAGDDPGVAWPMIHCLTVALDARRRSACRAPPPRRRAAPPSTCRSTTRSRRRAPARRCACPGRRRPRTARCDEDGARWSSIVELAATSTPGTERGSGAAVVGAGVARRGRDEHAVGHELGDRRGQRVGRPVAPRHHRDRRAAARWPATQSMPASRLESVPAPVQSSTFTETTGASLRHPVRPRRRRSRRRRCRGRRSRRSSSRRSWRAACARPPKSGWRVSTPVSSTKTVTPRPVARVV